MSATHAQAGTRYPFCIIDHDDDDDDDNDNDDDDGDDDDDDDVYDDDHDDDDDGKFASLHLVWERSVLGSR